MLSFQVGINGKSYPTLDELLDLADELKILRGQLSGLLRQAKLGEYDIDNVQPFTFI